MYKVNHDEYDSKNVTDIITLSTYCDDTTILVYSGTPLLQTPLGQI